MSEVTTATFDSKSFYLRLLAGGSALIVENLYGLTHSIQGVGDAQL